jgi:hypothetical protein
MALNGKQGHEDYEPYRKNKQKTSLRNPSEIEAR